MLKSLGLGTLGAMMLMSSLGYANEIIELSEEQLTQITLLNNQAYDAREAGDYAKAEKLFTAMIEIGEIDFVWMQLGKIYEAQGKCMLAEDAYRRVPDAPSTEDLPHDVVMQKLSELQQTFDQHCSAYLSFKCESPEIKIALDEDKAFQCSPEPIRVAPGKHNVVASASYGTNAFQVTASDGMTNDINVEIVNYEKIAENAGVTQEEVNRKSKTLKIAGWSLLGGGVAIAAAGGAIYGVSHKDYKDYHDGHMKDPGGYPNLAKKRTETNNKYYIAYGMIGVGAAAAVTGASLLIIDAVKYTKLKETLADNVLVTPYVGADSAGVGLSFEF